MLHSRVFRITAIVLIVSCAVVSASDFSIDNLSVEWRWRNHPILGTVPVDPADIVFFSIPGPPPLATRLVYPAEDIGLTAQDEIDAFSYGHDVLIPAGSNAWVEMFFSVTRDTLGAQGSVVEAQAAGNGASGDEFRVIVNGQGFNRRPPTLWEDGPQRFKWLVPFVPGGPLQTDVDGLSLSFFFGTAPSIYFSVDVDTADRLTNAGLACGPGDILYQRSIQPFWPPPIIVWATAAQLGLVAGDNIDAVAIRDWLLLGTLGPGDRVYVSLTPGSPTLFGPDGQPGVAGVDDDGVNGVDDIGEFLFPGSDDISPAAVIQVFPGPPVVIFPPAALGLRDDDDLNALWGFDPGKANLWSPTNRTEDVELDEVPLIWLPGWWADSHDVYFGTSWNDVNDANKFDLTGIYRGPNDVNIVIDPCDPNNIRYSYSVPESLDLVETYFWRVDEVNEPNVWKGDVWWFTTANYLVLDDIEYYNDGPGRIFFTWTDGCGWTNPPPGWPGNGTGSTVGYLIAPFCEQSIVHGGGQSMPYSYDNSGANEKAYYSEARRTFDSPQDWTILGVKALTLYFYGDPNNDANATEQMYVGLEDSSGASSYAEVKYGDCGECEEDMNDIKIAEWQEWNISLQDFNDAGVELTDVNRVYIGFGDRDEPVPGGSGIIYFDDIRLYLPRCVPSRLKPAADFTDDCVVDLAEVRIMAEDWLETEQAMESPANLYDKEPPDEQVINFRDFAFLADRWLEVLFWPPG